MRKKLSLLLAIIMVATVIYVPAGVYAEDNVEKEVIDVGDITYEEGGDGSSGFVNIEGLTIKLKDGVSQEVDNESKLLRRYGASATDTKFDPRENLQAANIVVKDQEDTNLCWAFSMTTAAERDYLKETEENIELSPGHMGYFFYNRVNDPLGNTGGDSNLINDSRYDYMSLGGNPMMSAQSLAGWEGFALEAAAPFENIIVGYDERLAYENSVILQNASFLDEISEVKDAVINDGAVVIGYHAPDNIEEALYYNREKSAYYCDDADMAANHAVAIVGWDDTFPADNFVITPIDEEGEPVDGAWIVQNSWGNNYGENGYFYLSFADTTACNYTAIDIQPADTYDYNYQYDGNAYPGMVPMSAGEKAANVFTVTENEKQLLEAVNFTTWTMENAQYTIEVYTDITNTEDPLSGNKECSFNVSTNNAGIYTFRLDDYGISPVYLESGTSYSIVINTDSDVNLGVEASYLSSTFKFVAENEAGESFLYAPSIGWYDCYESDYSVRIKGLVSVSDEIIVTEDISITGVENNETITMPYGTVKNMAVKFTPSNAMQRDIKWSSSVPDVASVDEKGKITTHGLGTTVVTAEIISGIKKSFTVKVTVPDLKAPSSITVNLYGYDDLKASWSKVTGATGYYVYYKRSTWSSWKSLKTTTATSKKLANMTDGAKYAFKVYPYVKIDGKIYKDSNYRTSSYVYALKKVGKPTIKKASRNYIKMTWGNIAGESGYQIARSTKKSSGYKVIKTISYKYKTTKIKTTRNKKYYYKIRAYKTVSGKKIYAPWSSVRYYKLR